MALSDTGRRQSAALGQWLAGQWLAGQWLAGQWLAGHAKPPRVVYCSPYARARETWQIAARELPPDRLPLVVTDQRLRDREMGDFELLLPAVIRRRYPAQARLREETGDLRYRPPGGESLADVGERLRDFLAGIDLADRPLLVAHDAVILMLRQLIEPMPEPELLRVPMVANASITRWQVRASSLRLTAYGDTTHLADRANGRT